LWESNNITYLSIAISMFRVMLTSSRDFLMFMPHEASLKTIYSYYLSTVNVNPEGDVSLSDEINHLGLGKSGFNSSDLTLNISGCPITVPVCWPGLKVPLGGMY